MYFGDIGKNSHTLLNYFEAGGARKCGDEENPAEYMLEIVGAGSHHKSAQDWPEVWKASRESNEVQTELDRIHNAKAKEAVSEEGTTGEFAMPLTSQIYHVTVRVFQQYWRTPSYIFGKIMLCIMTALFVGFSFFRQNGSRTGLQNTLFAIFMVTTTFSTLVQQVSYSL